MWDFCAIFHIEEEERDLRKRQTPEDEAAFSRKERGEI